MSILSKALKEPRQFTSKSLVAIHYRDHDSQHPRRLSGRYNGCWRGLGRNYSDCLRYWFTKCARRVGRFFSLIGLNYSRFKAFLIGALTGLVEPIGGLLGGIFVGLTEWLLPWVIAFSRSDDLRH